MNSLIVSSELPATAPRATLIIREERRRRRESRRWRTTWHPLARIPDYPEAFSEDEVCILLAAPDPLAIALYGIIFEHRSEWRHTYDLLDARQVNARFRAAGLRFADWRERHARSEAALAYLLDTGLITPGIDCPPFKFGAKWWLDRILRKQAKTPEQIERDLAAWRACQPDDAADETFWRWQRYEPSPAVRRDIDAAAPMGWRLLRRLPEFAHLPEQHPPRGETYAEAQRRWRAGAGAA